jgi:F0F1-type ATP synthase membrane subunit c/vacuolar-type H+-ATPase subunit K
MSASTSLAAALAAALVCGGCALGAGPWQPGRDHLAVAGSKGNIFNSSCERRRRDHQEAKQARVPELGGGNTSAYYMDGSLYLGIKQGVSWTRLGDTDFSDGQYMFELHLTLTQQLFGDRVIVGASAFAAGYGTGDDSSTAPFTYVPFGGELVIKVPLLSGLGLHLTGGPTYGNVTRDDDGTKVASWGGRASFGVDLVLTEVFCEDVVLVVEGQDVRTGALDDFGGETFEGRALLFQLALGAY